MMTGWRYRARPITRWDYIKAALIMAGPLVIVIVLILVFG